MLDLRNLSACLVSKHKKADHIAGILNDAFGWQVNANETFNTDMLGTFSGESERTLTALECAIYKAEKALTLCNDDIGLGSEGSFNPDAYGVMTVNQELLACMHRKHGLLAVGKAIRPVHVKTWTLQRDDIGALNEIIEALPQNQALLMRLIDPSERNISVQYGNIYKGLLSREQIHAAFAALSETDAALQLEVCYDLRAMHCPERQVTLGLAANNLVERLQSVCPQCNAFDFYAEVRVPGLLCETCQLPTSMTKAFKATCNHCDFKSLKPVEQRFAETVNCPFCNP